MGRGTQYVYIDIPPKKRRSLWHREHSIIRAFFKQAIGTRLEELLLEDKQNVDQMIAMVSDENKQRDLIIEDEEEDFLDEGDFTRSQKKNVKRIAFRANN